MAIAEVSLLGANRCALDTQGSSKSGLDRAIACERERFDLHRRQLACLDEADVLVLRSTRPLNGLKRHDIEIVDLQFSILRSKGNLSFGGQESLLRLRRHVALVKPKELPR
jgi:hypothetical protein